jgi:hypothetical protein
MVRFPRAADGASVGFIARACDSHNSVELRVARVSFWVTVSAVLVPFHDGGDVATVQVLGHRSSALRAHAQGPARHGSFSLNRNPARAHAAVPPRRARTAL